MWMLKCSLQELMKVVLMKCCTSDTALVITSSLPQKVLLQFSVIVECHEIMSKKDILYAYNKIINNVDRLYGPKNIFILMEK